MMKRYICLLAILTAIAALLCGCSLARSDMDASAASRDRLIGVYITTEYIDLFDLEGYIGANASALSGGSIGEADAAQYNGRLYAELVDERYVFPGVDGFACELPAGGDILIDKSMDKVFAFGNLCHIKNILSSGFFGGRGRIRRRPLNNAIL